MTVVLVDPRRPALVPIEAIGLLVGEVAYTEEMPVAVPGLAASLPTAHAVHAESVAPVLLSSDRDHPAVIARLAAGEQLLAAAGPAAGERLIDAVAMIDRLRSTGPWERDQTHDSLRRFLLEETYELFDAVRSGDADELRAELGDVLLQVLFHARIAQEAPAQAFTIDDVADTLVRKLGNRAATVLAGEPITRDDQLAQWEQRKASEKARASVMDDVPTGQPALALTQKVIGRAHRAGLPADLIPAVLTSITVTVESDDNAEMALRSAALEFIEMVRSAEGAIAEQRHAVAVSDPIDGAPLGQISEQEWRAGWPAAGA